LEGIKTVGHLCASDAVATELKIPCVSDVQHYMDVETPLSIAICTAIHIHAKNVSKIAVYNQTLTTIR